VCAVAWTRCCSGDAGSTEVVSHASGASFVDARQRSPTLVDASQRRLPTTFPVWGRLASVSVRFGPAFPSQDGWRGMMVAGKAAVVAPVAHTSRHRLVDVVAVIMNHVAEGHSA